MFRPGLGFWKGREDALAAEWLETNGLGGYASSTLTGTNTRRYHGLLVAATQPPVGRAVLLSKVEETLVIEEDRFELAMNQYPGTISPEGDRFLTGFAIDPFPRFVYEAGGVTLTKTLFLVYGEDTLVLRYDVEGAGSRPVRLEVRPLLAYRDHHAIGRERSDWGRAMGILPGSVTLKPGAALPGLSIAHDATSVEETGYWYRDFEYERERERGFDFREDLFNPLQLVFDLSAKTEAVLVVSTGSRAASDEPALRESELARRRAIEGPAGDPPALRAFRRAADQFLVARGASKCGEGTVIAGYPWFCDWGRDTMISLPGLTLSSGRSDVARQVLATFASALDGGMIPNRFPDHGEGPEYNTVDATLWFIEAVRSYGQTTRDHAFVRELYPRLLGIVRAHEQGTRYGIKLDEDGLLASGEEGVQLTWMDARIGDWVVTPRRGKPVEIQALWHNAVCFLAGLARDLSDAANAERLSAMALRARESFESLFWNEEADCLYDVVDGDFRDGSIRPNQIFAISLRHPLVLGRKAELILAAVERHLLTPFGLRTLAPSDPRYVGRYEGGPEKRDGAYHQGTVWPWLVGPYIQALLKVNGTKEG
ncbi:MAG: amylo-alpha-1,6-glucosidase, partial [Thermoanaerobaculia bacterium]